MKTYMTDKEMLKREQLLALVCLGGMAEGFDYKSAKERMLWWAKKRQECGYQGGFAEED